MFVKKFLDFTLIGLYVFFDDGEHCSLISHLAIKRCCCCCSCLLLFVLSFKKKFGFTSFSSSRTETLSGFSSTIAAVHDAAATSIAYSED